MFFRVIEAIWGVFKKIIFIVCFVFIGTLNTLLKLRNK